jgi:hypothetical protein
MGRSVRVIRPSEVLVIRRKVRDAADARSCLAQAERSKQGLAEWAQQHGVDGRSLNMWRLNLERVDSPVPRPRLVELIAAPEPARTARYAVRVGDFAVEVDEHFDTDVLRRLISAVSSC